MPGKQGHRGFGYLRKLPSRRYQASYLGPDGQRYTAPGTFDTRLDAEAWLAAEHRLTESDEWASPEARRTSALVDRRVAQGR